MRIKRLFELSGGCISQLDAEASYAAILNDF
jgi:hypothetical protein